MRGWGSRLPWKLKYPSASPGKYSGSAQMGSCINLAYKYIVLHYPYPLYWTFHYLIFSDKQNGRNEIFVKCFYTESSCRGMYLSLPNLKIILFLICKIFSVLFNIFKLLWISLKPEPITGSSRMKSGSATKVLLETIFTGAILSAKSGDRPWFVIVFII